MAVREQWERRTVAPPPARRRPRLPRVSRRAVAVAAGGLAVLTFLALARVPTPSSGRIAVEATENAPARAPRLTRALPAGGNLIRPVDPVTLADVPTTILSVTGEGGTTVSPDGRLLAVWGEQGAGPGSVSVVEAGSFQPVATVTEPSADWWAAGFAPESDALVVLRWESGATVARHPLDGGETTSVELPGPLEVASQVVPLRDGRAAVFAYTAGPEGEADWTGAPRVLVVDLLAERVVVDLALPQVRAGRALRSASGQEEVREEFSPGLGWDVERERLYIAHAAAERITVVDLAAGAVVAEGDLQPPEAPADPPAEQAAAGGLWAGASRHAVVSPDGERLYLAGWVTSTTEDGMHVERVLDLTVVDTAGLRRVGQVDGGSGFVTLSPDGRWLTQLAGVPPAGVAGGPAGVHVLDAVTLEPVGEVPIDTPHGADAGFSRDSSHLYVQLWNPTGVVIRAFALPSLRQTGERELDHASWFDIRAGLLVEQL